MCTEETKASLRGWLRDPLIRLVMESDGVTEKDLIALVRRVSIAKASHDETMPPPASWQLAEAHHSW